MTLPSGLIWRPEFAPQHGGDEKPRVETKQSTTPGKAEVPGDPKSQGTKGTPPACMDTQMLWMMAAMFAVIYFFMIRPSQKQEKEQKAMRSGLQKGDSVVMTSGLHGEILSVDEKAQTVTIQTDSEGRVRMTFDTAAISRKVVADDAGGTDAKT